CVATPALDASLSMRAMSEAAKYYSVALLPNGRQVEIRALKPDDHSDFRTAMEHTSAGSLYRRFFWRQTEFYLAGSRVLFTSRFRYPCGLGCRRGGSRPVSDRRHGTLYHYAVSQRGGGFRSD